MSGFPQPSIRQPADSLRNLRVRFIQGKKAGMVLDVPASTAVNLIQSGMAVPVQDAPECAVLEAPEHAVIPLSRNRP